MEAQVSLAGLVGFRDWAKFNMATQFAWKDRIGLIVSTKRGSIFTVCLARFILQHNKMKWLILSSWTTASWAFAPSNSLRSTGTALFSAPPAEETIVREAPGAGWVPDWEDRPGLPEEEFLKSDMSKADLSGMWECPLTRWDAEG